MTPRSLGQPLSPRHALISRMRLPSTNPGPARDADAQPRASQQTDQGLVGPRPKLAWQVAGGREELSDLLTHRIFGSPGSAGILCGRSSSSAAMSASRKQ